MNTKQKTILTILQNVIEQGDVTAVLEKNPEAGTGTLYAEYPGPGNKGRGMIVTITFLPPVAPKAHTTMDCMIQVLIAEDIPEETFPTLKQGLSILNYITARGGFLMTPDCTKLMYRNTVNFLSNQSDEDILKTILYHVASGLAIAEIWTETFEAVIEGRMDFEQFVRYIGAYASEKE